MVSMVILSICIAATLNFGASLTNSFREQRRMIQVERAARVSLEIVADALRNASAGIPNGDIKDLVGCTAYGALQVTNSTTAPDELQVIYASGGLVSSIRQVFDASSTELLVLDGDEYVAGDYALVTDFTTGHITAVTGVNPSGSEWSLAVNSPSASCASPGIPVSGYQPGALVIRARVARFFVSTGPEVGGIPTLMMDPDDAGPLQPEPLAEGIEDFQIAVGVDVNGDGTVFEDGSSTDEWFYNNAADLAPPLLTATPPRAFRITMIARSVAENTEAPTSTRPAVEDRLAGTADPYRRRVLSVVVEIRNLEGSP